MNTYIYECSYTHIYAHAFTYAHSILMHMHIPYLYIYSYIYIYINANRCVHINAYIYVHTYMHTRAHTHANSFCAVYDSYAETSQQESSTNMCRQYLKERERSSAAQKNSPSTCNLAGDVQVWHSQKLLLLRKKLNG